MITRRIFFAVVYTLTGFRAHASETPKWEEHPKGPLRDTRGEPWLGSVYRITNDSKYYSLSGRNGDYLILLSVDSIFEGQSVYTLGSFLGSGAERFGGWGGSRPSQFWGGARQSVFTEECINEVAEYVGHIRDLLPS